MVRKSIIEIQIEALGRAMAQVLFRRRNGDNKGAQAEINVAANQLAGMDANAMILLSDESLVSLFTPDEGVQAGKCLVAGALLKEEAELLDEEGRADAAAAARRKALRLYLEALIDNEYLRTRKYPAEAEALLAEVEEKDGLPVSILRRLTRYHEAMGQYARAEDLLFELQDRGYDRWQRDATAFFQRLLTLPDEKLEAGGLSREEVEEGLAEVWSDNSDS